MPSIRSVLLILGGFTVLITGIAPAAEDPEFTRQRDVIYARKYGTVLTMDVFKPKEKANGAAVLFMVSGGWVSSHDHINVHFANQFLKRGYTVFAVVHGSQPKFTIPECVADVKRAVRYIRHHAKDFGIDPERLGVSGVSAGGHLSLMLGTNSDAGDEKAKDPIDRASCRVQAVACFVPPTDFLNYGEPGKEALGRGSLSWLRAPFDFQELDKKTNALVIVEDEGRRREIGKQISPITHVTTDDAPTLIFHGEKDRLVPLQQAEIMIAKLKSAGVPSELVVKTGADHTWPTMPQDMARFADWFDKHLQRK
jgi:acetyl esterase/lipase